MYMMYKCVTELKSFDVGSFNITQGAVSNATILVYFKRTPVYIR